MSLLKITITTSFLVSILLANESYYATLDDATLASLSKISVSAATLTEIESNKVPASVTHITRKMIEESGSRNLDELLEIYVPNLMTLDHHGSGQHVGIRGIISDLDNKMLLLVNGRVMNEKAVFGAVTERYLSLLGDIDYIDVIRGPGAAIFGPGAISGVIDIHTLDSKSFEGAEVTLRAGAFEEFASLEVKYATQLNEDMGLFVYYGLDDYKGANPEYAPLYSSSVISGIPAGTPLKNISNHHGTPYGALNHKLHVSLETENFKSWVRYTEGGTSYNADVGEHYDLEDSSSVSRYLYYKQFTFKNEYKKEIAKDLKIRVSAAFDSTYTFESKVDKEVKWSTPEEEINLKAYFNYTPSDNHSLAVGSEYAREYYGQDSLGLADHETVYGGKADESFESDTLSFVGEYQWNLNDTWTFFAGGRMDKNTYSDWLYSPKVALVLTPDDKNSMKLIYNNSVRKTDNRESRVLVENGTIDSAETENIESVEFRHDYIASSQLNIAYALFYYEYDLISWNLSTWRESEIGTQKTAGAELELDYTIDNHNIAFSHSYTKLVSLDLSIDINNNAVSAEPYGYGSDLANWSPHITKARWLWDITNKLNMNTTLRILWGFPGASDYAQYNANELQETRLTRTDGSQDAFKETAYLNIGYRYNFTDNFKARLDFYNVLGLIDESLNKKNRYNLMGDYRIEAPAAALRLGYTF